jgi:ribonuclease VapC
MACRDDPRYVRPRRGPLWGAEARDFVERIRAADVCRISGANHVELSRVESQLGPDGDLARQAFLDFGKGRHKAGLNFGDCFAYALARATGEALLFKGAQHQ